jgi:hypothetical protein
MGARIYQGNLEDGVFKNGVLQEGRKNPLFAKETSEKVRARNAKRKWLLKFHNFSNQIVFSSKILILNSK